MDGSEIWIDEKVGYLPFETQGALRPQSSCAWTFSFTRRVRLEFQMGSINKTGVINRSKFSSPQRIRTPLKTSIEQSRIKERRMNKTVGVPDNQKIIRRIGVNNIRSNYETIVPHGVGDKAQGKKSHVESVFADYELKQYAEISTDEKIDLFFVSTQVGSSYSEGIYWKSATI